MNSEVRIKRMEHIFSGTSLEYEAIVEKHKSAVYGTIYAYISWNYETDDIAQDVFIYAYYNYGKLSDPSKLGAWLCGIARNTALKRLRSSKFSLSLDYARDKVRAADPETGYIKSESRREIMSAVTGLSKPVAEVILLFYFSGKSIREISELLAITEGAVKSRLHDGRKKLKKELVDIMKEIGTEKGNDDLEKRVNAALEKAKEAASKHQHSDARAYCDEALEIIGSEGYHREIVEIYRLRASANNSREGKITDGEKEVAAARKSGDKKLLCESLLSAAMNYYSKEDKTSYYHEAYTLALEINYRAIACECAYWIGANMLAHDPMRHADAEIWLKRAIEHHGQCDMSAAMILCDGDVKRVRALAVSARDAINRFKELDLFEKGYMSLGTFCQVLNISDYGIHNCNSYGWNIPGSVDCSFYNHPFPLFSQPIIIPAEYVKGASFTVQRINYFGDYDGVTNHIKYDIISDNDTVETPAGTFDNCIRLRVTEVIPSYNADDENQNRLHSYLAESEFCFAKGVGCLKGIRKYPNADFAGCEFILTSYKAEKCERHPYLPLVEGNCWQYATLSAPDDVVLLEDKFTVDLVLEDSAYISQSGGTYAKE